jgi:transposase InsO family protein
LIESGNHKIDAQGDVPVGAVIQAAVRQGLSVESVTFPRGSYLDIGTPADLRKAVRTIGNTSPVRGIGKNKEAKVAQEALVLTEAQVVVLEKAKADKEAHGEFESECPGYCGAQDTFHVGTLKGVCRISQQTFIDTYSKVGVAKLYDRKTPVTAADLLNDRVLPFFEHHENPLPRVLTDRGTEYCGSPERHEYDLYLAVEHIDHTRTKIRHPQTTGLCERFHKTMLNEFYRVAFRKKIYRSLDDLQTDLDVGLQEYNERRPHQGRWCYGKTPLQTFVDSVPLAKEKMLAA